MFNADITWTPVTDMSSEAKRPQKKEADNRSVQSKSSRRFRWPLSKGSTTQSPTGSEHGKQAKSIGWGNQSPSLSVASNSEPSELATSNCGPDPSAISARDQVFELPATVAIEAHSAKSPPRITAPVSNPLSVSTGTAEVLNHITPITSANPLSSVPGTPSHSVFSSSNTHTGETIIISLTCGY
jgi:hypothetical protein